ncbi:MAG: hypothetical protein MHMPM18_002173 [Marteilia pararefringens]
MVIGSDLDILISNFLTVIIPVNFSLGVVVGLISSISFFYYCYQLSKPCLRRSKNINGKTSDKPSTSENSEGSHGKTDPESVQKIIIDSKNFSKDSIHSSNEHKLQSTNVTTSSQDDRKEQNVASDTEGDVSKFDGKNMKKDSPKMFSRINEGKNNQVRQLFEDSHCTAV